MQQDPMQLGSETLLFYTDVPVLFQFSSQLTFLEEIIYLSWLPFVIVPLDFSKLHYLHFIETVGCRCNCDLTSWLDVV